MTDYFTALLDSALLERCQARSVRPEILLTHILHKPWAYVDLIKPSKALRLPDIVTVEEANWVSAATYTLSYRVVYFTVYSPVLRLGEGLPLQVGDIDATSGSVHIRDAEGNKDRLVPLPVRTLDLLRRFWLVASQPRVSVSQSPRWL